MPKGFTSETAKAAALKSSRAGAPNKVSTELKKLLNEVSREAAERIVQKLDLLNSKELIQLLSVTAKYVLPSLSSISADIEMNKLNWNELSIEEKQQMIKHYFDEEKKEQ